MISLKFNTSYIADGVLLVSGAGDRDTGGGLCALDADSSETIDRVSTSGMAVCEGRLARLLRTPLSTGGGEILIYDGRGVSHYLRVDELSDSHTLAWAGQDLIVSSTGTNSLLWISLSGKVLRRWRAPGEDDSWHLNDVYLVGGRVYACSFGRFAHYRDYKDHILTGTGCVFDIVSGRSVVTNLCAPHSPRYFDGAWTVCDSLRNSVVQVDADGHRIQQATLRSLTRGLAVTDDYVIVGESAQRVPGGGSATASVAVLRRDDFSFVARFDVPFSEIGEIVIVPRDLLQAVKTGFRTNAMRVSESDQLQMFRAVGIEPKRLWAVSEALTADQCKVRIDAEFPASFICGKPTLVSCTVQNLSEAFLCSEAPYPVLLSYRWKDSRDSAALAGDDENRTRLPRMLPPGSSTSLRMDVKAPDVEGEFELLITLVQEHVIWFDSVDPSNGCCAKVKVVRAESGELLCNSSGSVSPLSSRDLSGSTGPGNPSAETIQALSAGSEYDFRLTAYPEDSMRDRFLEWVSYYRMKWAIARALRPKLILEIGVRYGYSAAAFLDACPDAVYLGIDIDADEFGGTKGAINWARKITASYSAEFLVADSQKMSAFPGPRYDLIHVDGQQDGDGSFHDLQLAIRQGRFVLVDGFFWTTENFRTISEFLIRYRDLIDYYLVIPGYAGELLIKTRPLDPGISAPAQVRQSEDLRRSYTSEYYLQDCGGFDEYRRTGGKELGDDRLATVAAIATIQSCGRALDLGCGRGELAYYLAGQGFWVTAVDYSRDAIGLAEQTFAGDPVLRSRVELCQANIAELNLSGSYDLVIASDVVEHVTATELERIYGEISTHLAPTGIFIVHTYPNLWYFLYDYARRRRVASSAGAYLPKEPRTRYELLMHINEQNPRVLKRQLARYFPNVLLWFGAPGNMGGSLMRNYSHRELAASRDLWAIACHRPIDAAAVRSRLASYPLPSAQLGVIRMAILQVPSKVSTNQNFTVTIEITNPSVCVLASMPPAPVNISYHWMSGDGQTEVVWDGVRTLIRPPLLPGTKRNFEAAVVGPSLPGTYRLKMTLVQEGVRWFDAVPIHLVSEAVVQVTLPAEFQTGTVPPSQRA